MFITGTITQVFPVTSHNDGKGHVYKTQAFMLHSDGRIASDAVLSIFESFRINKFNVKVGDKVTAHFNVRAKKLGNTWINDLHVWKIGPPPVYDNMTDIVLKPKSRR